MASDLRDCPFCGLVYDDGPLDFKDGMDGEEPTTPYGHAPWCPFMSHDPLEGWNQRAIPREVKELLEMVEGYASTIFRPKCEAVRAYYGIQEKKNG